MPVYEVESPVEFEAFTEPDVTFEVAQTVRREQRRQYASGYDQALQNLLTSLVPLAERHLGRAGMGSPQARKSVYAFIEYLEQHIERAAADAEFVADGLGI